MGYPKCNQTEEYERIDEAKIWHNMEFHHFGLILSAVFGLVAILVSWYLIYMHCTHYLKPWEQRHIIRILFMVPIYAFVSFVSYLFYRHAIYYEVIRDCYEAFAIASFFFLLCHYLAPDLHSQKDYFRNIVPKNWVWPVPWFQRCYGGRDGQNGPLRIPRSGLTWFNVIYVGIFQYCFIRVFMTIVAVITEAAGIYCLESLNPAFAHVWVMVIEGICVTIAMYCLIQFYWQLKDDLAEHKPLLKVAAIKLVIFLSFWQTLLISFLTSSGAIKPSAKIQTPDIKIGIPSMLLCIEMAFFAVYHLWAFPWKVYDIKRSALVASESAPGYLPDPKTAYLGGRFGEKALLDAFNPWDFVKAVGRAARWAFVGRKTRMQDVSYAQNKVAGAGLEPSQGRDGAYGQSSFDDESARPGMSGAATEGSYSYSAARKSAGSGGKSHYRSLSSEDQDRLLMTAQSNPTLNPTSNPYGMPMGRASPRDPALKSRMSEESDIGTAHTTPGRTEPYYQDSTGHLMASGAAKINRQQQYTAQQEEQPYSSRGSGFEDQDTSYHRSAAAPASTPMYQSYHLPSHSESQQQQQQRRAPPALGLRPDDRPLGPPGRGSHEQAEWDMWGGVSRTEDHARGEDERGLGGGHGVHDNRF